MAIQCESAVLKPIKVARNSFLARAAWAADYACSREHTKLTQVQI